MLAVEALAIRTREWRRPDEHRLLKAFLASKQAHRVHYTATDLASDFNSLVKKTDPLRLDDVIEELMQEARRVAEQNKERSAKQPLNRRKKSGVVARQAGAAHA